jgi:hypothetical protein
MSQFAESFKDAIGFKDVTREGSMLRIMLTSEYLSTSPTPENAEEGSKKINVSMLMCLGIMYCCGTAKAKAAAFYDVV